MLQKKFLFVSLLAPSLSFASTATDSLSGATRDIFDNLDENPAFVNVEGGKSFLRLGKEAGAQLITNAGGFGLGVQVNSSSEFPVITDANGNFTSKDAPEAFSASTDILEKTAEAVSKTGLPVTLSLGGVAGDLKWGLGLGYQSIKRTGSVETTGTDANGRAIDLEGLDPSYSMMGVTAGVIMGELEASLGWSKSDWKLATSRSAHDGNIATADKVTTYMKDGVSAQVTTIYGLATRYQTKPAQWYLTYTQAKSDFKLWDFNEATNNSGSEFDAKDAMKLMLIEAGGERSDTLTEGIKLLSKASFGYGKRTTNFSKGKIEETDMSLSSAHGLEVAAASWVTLRAGVRASLWGSSAVTQTGYENGGQAGKSEEDTTKTTKMMRGLNAPTMGVGFKFGNYMVDATLAQDGTGDLGFSDKVLGKVEVTAQF